jgi:hypothetical protein
MSDATPLAHSLEHSLGFLKTMISMQLSNSGSTSVSRQKSRTLNRLSWHKQKTSGSPSRLQTEHLILTSSKQRDISAADSKFAGRKYKPTALILEYPTSRASKQNVPVPSFINEKSSVCKRFNPMKQRPLYNTEQESWEAEDGNQQLEEDWQEEYAEDDASSSLDSLAFQQKSAFRSCTTQCCKDRNIAHIHSTERFYKLQPPKGKGAPGKGTNSLLFTKGSKGKGKGHGKGKGKPEKGKGLKPSKGNSLKV